MTELGKYTRVTSCLYPFSGLSYIDAQVLKNAADRGTKVHECCDAIIDDLGLGEIDNSLYGYIESFEKWKGDKVFVTKPKRLYCENHLITGEVDGLYKNEDGFTLFDIKTPMREGKTWKLQGSAYAYLCRINGINITRIEFVRLPKDGSNAVSYFYEEQLEENLSLFFKCLEIYRHFFVKKKDIDVCDYL